MRLGILFATFLALAGCASIPEGNGEAPIYNGTEIARSVELCKTNISELQARLGQPSRDGLLGKARVVTWIVAWDPFVKYLGVMADESGRVIDLYWNLPSEVTWSPINQCK